MKLTAKEVNTVAVLSQNVGWLSYDQAELLLSRNSCLTQNVRRVMRALYSMGDDDRKAIAVASDYRAWVHDILDPDHKIGDDI